jgi:hypothetical protein
MLIAVRFAKLMAGIFNIVTSVKVHFAANAGTSNGLT